jgi:hypothetical protein
VVIRLERCSLWHLPSFPPLSAAIFPRIGCAAYGEVGANCMSSYSNGSRRNPALSAVAVVAFIFLECLVVVQAFLAHGDHFLTVSQMRQRGIDYGLPFAWHFAMWSDLTLVSPLAAYLIGRFYRGWSLRSVLSSLAFGFISSGLLHSVYTFSGMPEAHVQNHALTATGIVHAIYMGTAFSVFVQFFFFTQDVTPRMLRVVSVILVIHVFIGTHMALGIHNMVFPVDWYPGQPLRSIFGWATIAALTLGLLWRNLRGSK